MKRTMQGLLSSVIAVVLLIFSLQIWELATSYGSAMQLAEDRAALRCRSNVHHVADLIKQVDLILLDCRERLEAEPLQAGDTAQMALLSQHLRSHLTQLPGTISLYRCDSQGRIGFSSCGPLAATTAMDPACLLQLRAPGSDRLAVSELLRDPLSRHWCIAALRPIDDGHGALAGAVVATVEADALRSVMDGRDDQGRQWAMTVVDEHRRIIFRFPRQQDSIGSTLPETGPLDLTSSCASFSGTLPGDPEPRSWSMLRLEDFPLRALAGYSHVVALQDWRWNLTVNLAAAASIVAGLALAARLLQRVRSAAEREYNSEQRFRTFIEKAPVAISVHRSGKVIFANAAALRLHHVPPTASPIGSDALAWIAPESRGEAQLRLDRLQRGEPPTDDGFELSQLHADGSSFPAQVSAAAMELADGPAIICFASDISERRRAEDALRTSEQRYRDLYNKTPAMMVSFDVRGQITAVSDAMLAHFGYARADVLGRLAVDFMTPEYRLLALKERLPLFFSLGWTRDSHYQFLNRAGEVLDILISAIVDRHASGAASVIAVLTDVTARLRAETELRQSQGQLVQAQKMDAIGRLAGGMAHDFNNMLTAMVGYASLLQLRLPAGSPDREHAAGILRSAEQATALTRQLLVFSRKQVASPTVLDLNAVVADLEPMLRRLIREDVALVVAPCRDLWPMRADAGQIGQVVMNLVVNARDAMPTGGRLVIAMCNRTVPASEAGRKPPPGSWVQISVSDTGCGMNSEVMAHLFEPFYTTKSPGDGTGLGLSIIYGIVTQNGGHISVSSSPGQGSLFTLSFPPCAATVVPRSPALAPAPYLPSLTRGKSVLVVEDEAEVRNTLRQVLGEHGLTVHCANDGMEALALIDERRLAIDVLLTDVIMPRLGGRDLASRLATRSPRLPIIFMSGYTGESGAPQDLEGANRRFLAKPFTSQALFLAIEAALASTA